MNLLEAVIQVLSDAGEALHYEEITNRVLASGLWETTGKTPAATLSAQLSSDIKKHGSTSRFMRTGSGIYALNDGSAVTHQPKPTGKLTFLEAARLILSEEADKTPMHYKEITRRAIARNLIDTQGLTPEATMYAQIVTSVNKAETQGDVSVFTKAGKGMVGLTEWEEPGAAAGIKKHSAKVRQELLARVLEMDPFAFEEMLGRLLAEMGFEEIQVTKPHGDKGVDLRGTLVVSGGIPIRMSIQAKRWKAGVQAPEVQKVRGASAANERALIITTSSFGPGARGEAGREGFPPVGLIDGTELVGLMIEHGIGAKRTSYDVIDLEETSI